MRGETESMVSVLPSAQRVLRKPSIELVRQAAPPSRLPYSRATAALPGCGRDGAMDTVTAIPSTFPPTPRVKGPYRAATASGRRTARDPVGFYAGKFGFTGLTRLTVGGCTARFAGRDDERRLP